MSPKIPIWTGATLTRYGCRPLTACCVYVLCMRTVLHPPDSTCGESLAANAWRLTVRTWR